MERKSNKDFAKEDVKFQKACEKAGIPATTRQASKYRAKKGLAYSCS